MSYWVYILSCSDSSLYTGISKDPNRRLDVHNRGKGAKYTRARLPVKLVYQEYCGEKSLALRREIFIKKLRREEKLSLILSGQIEAPST